MDIKERAKWLKWSKLGVCIPSKNYDETGTEDNVPNVQKSLARLLKHQEEIERNSYEYIITNENSMNRNKRKGDKAASKVSTKRRKYACKRKWLELKSL